MEPIAASGAGAASRPPSGASGDLQALLRDGRVLKAEVLQRSADGTVLLAVGRHRIPAETDVRLDPGATFLVRVQEEAQGIVLRWLAPEEGEVALLRALRAVLGEQRPLGAALAGLAQALRTASAELPADVHALARGLTDVLVRAGSGPAHLRALLAVLGHGHEASLAALLGARGIRPDVAELRGSLKALLLRAQAALEGHDGEHSVLRESVARALGSLEAEQLLNVARERAGEPLLFSFPFPDGEGWTTARLSVPARERDRDGAHARGDAPFRLALGVELSNLGPLRADLTLTPSLLAVRLLVTRAEIARRIEAELGELRHALAGGRRALELSVRIATGAETELGPDPLDTRYLREHNLMDVVG